MGRRGVVTAGHYLAATAGFRIMEQGGNAIDAAAAMGFCVNLVEPNMCGLGGEMPTLIYSAEEKKTYALSGMGWSPEALTIDWCREHNIDLIPGDGHLPACVPSIIGSWGLALARFGTMSFAQVMAPAIELAEDGYAMYPTLHKFLVDNRAQIEALYPTTFEVFYPNGEAPQVGDLVRNLDWAGVLKQLCAAEADAAGKGRIAGIEAAVDVFYRGPIAERIVDYITSTPVRDKSGEAHSGLLSLADFADWEATLEEPVTVNYKGLDMHKCSSWTQGPVFSQQLTLLDGLDLKAMGHNTADYLHHYTECAKLAFADREAYYGDPLMDNVPFDVLLSQDYADTRRSLIGDAASTELRPGDVGQGIPEFAIREVLEDNQRALGIAGGANRVLTTSNPHKGDTTHLDAIDAQGNMVSCTPSGGWIHESPVVPGLGFPLGTRAQMFFLNAERPNALAPRKRPRATLTPSMVTRQGEPYMAFGTPGGDTQDQITLQFFLNYVEFGMNLQEALDAPVVFSEHFPSSFYPRERYPARLVVEGRIPDAVIEELGKRGHDIKRVSDWDDSRALAIRYDAARGLIHGGASPRNTIAYALGW
jgi:gamma-glutamyltranspeptidase/glutathione hydrolase